MPNSTPVDGHGRAQTLVWREDVGTHLPTETGFRRPANSTAPIDKVAPTNLGITKSIAGIPQPRFYPAMSSTSGTIPWPPLEEHRRNLE